MKPGGNLLYFQELLLQAQSGRVCDPNISSFSPLHCALVSGNEQCAQLLLSHSASVSCQDSLGFSVLHITAATNLLNTTSILLSKGAEVNARDSRQRTPLMLAARRGHVNMLEVLMAAKADCELEDGDSNTALHLACKAGMSRSANLLLRKVSSDLVSRQNSLGKSALHLAAGKGLVETTELLLAAGASVTCVDAVVRPVSTVISPSNISHPPLLQGNPPALDCAGSEDTATCLAMILSVYLATPTTTETRKSLIKQFRKSEIFGRLSAGLEVEESPVKTNGSEHSSHCSSDTEYY